MIKCFIQKQAVSSCFTKINLILEELNSSKRNQKRNSIISSFLFVYITFENDSKQCL